MTVDTDTVKRIARLARIAVTDDEAAALQDELSTILEWVEQLSEVDVAGVPAMASAVDVRMAWREDAVTDGDIPDKVLANAPQTDDGYFVVPRVVE